MRKALIILKRIGAGKAGSLRMAGNGEADALYEWLKNSWYEGYLKNDSPQGGHFSNNQGKGWGERRYCP